MTNPISGQDIKLAHTYISHQHYNRLFEDIWLDQGWDVTYQPSCLQNPPNDGAWLIRFPAVSWHDRTLVVLHCQDYLTWNGTSWNELDQIEQHFGDNADRVVVVVWDRAIDYHGPCHVIYFPAHSYDVINQLANHEHGAWLRRYQQPVRPRIWQCLNGCGRPHRRQVFDWIRDLPRGVASYWHEHPLPVTTYQQWQESGMGADSKNFFNLEWLYSTTQINVVTETVYTGPSGIITEKTLFAFAAGQIPLVIGHRGLVQQCRELGFDMFDDIVDTSYDQLGDDQRWCEALQRNRALLEQGVDASSVATRLQNQQHYLLENWRPYLVSLFQAQVARIQDCLARP